MESTSGSVWLRLPTTQSAFRGGFGGSLGLYSARLGGALSRNVNAA
jgi:hypothetical protein